MVLIYRNKQCDSLRILAGSTVHHLIKLNSNDPLFERLWLWLLRSLQNKSRQLARLSVQSEFSVARLKLLLNVHMFHQNNFLPETILQRHCGSARCLAPPMTIVIMALFCHLFGAVGLLEPFTCMFCAGLMPLEPSDSVTTRTEMRRVCIDLSNSGGYGE